MKTETIGKTPNSVEEEFLIKKSGIPFFVKRILEDKGIRPDISECRQADKFLLDINWDFTSNKKFCKNISITVGGNKEIFINGAEELKITTEDLKNKKQLRKRLVKIVKNPASRSEAKFTLN